jgi:hypothetical protein
MLQRLFGVFERFNNAVGAHEEPLALLRQAEGPRGAVEQPGSEPVLQALDDLADGRGIAVQAACGRRKAPFFCDAQEGVELTNAVIHGVASLAGQPSGSCASWPRRHA